LRVITKARLVDFWTQHPNAESPLSAWHRIVSKTDFSDFNDLRSTFPSADYVPPRYTVFNIGGNKFRLITSIHYDTGCIYIREVLTHAQYTKWEPPK
jgi:mRNA interferase HigB